MKPKKLSLALWEGSRDTALIAGFLLGIVLLQQIRHGQGIVVPDAHAITLSLVVLLVTWTAMVIACRLGASSLTDYPRLDGRAIPLTVPVFVVTSMVTFIVLLLMGLVS